MEDYLLNSMEQQFKDAESDYASEVKAVIDQDVLHNIIADLGKKPQEEMEKKFSPGLGIGTRDFNIILRSILASSKEINTQEYSIKKKNERNEKK